jgi:hypothetical protein
MTLCHGRLDCPVFQRLRFSGSRLPHTYSTVSWLMEFSFLLGMCGGTCLLVEANSLFISPRCIEWPFSNLVAFLHVGCEAVIHLTIAVCVCVCISIYGKTFTSMFIGAVTFSTTQMLRWTTTFGKCIIVLMTESCICSLSWVLQFFSGLCILLECRNPDIWMSATACSGENTKCSWLKWLVVGKPSHQVTSTMSWWKFECNRSYSLCGNSWTFQCHQSIRKERW